MRCVLGVLLVVVFSYPASSPQATEPGTQLANEARETMLDLAIADLVLRVAEFEAETCDEAVRLDSRVSSLDPASRKRLTTDDAWGRPFLYWSCKTPRVLVSLGQNGQLDHKYNFADATSLMASPGGDDIILRDGEFVAPLSDRRRQEVTMADVRSIGTSTEAFAVDNDVYPGPTAGIATIEVVRDQLEPVYIRTLPTTDAWGNPYLFWSDGGHYVIISLGSDGVEDVAYDATDPTSGLKGGAARRYESDIVFSDGQFHQWPEGAQY